MYTFHTESVHFGTLNHIWWNIIPRISITKNHKEQLIIPEMVSSNSFTKTRWCQNYKPNCGTKNVKYIKMASNKNEQNLAPCDLKRTNCTINLPLVSTILIYFVSWDSLKVFFVTKFRVFIFTCHKMACKLTYVEACSDRGKKWDSWCYYWKSKQNI